MEVTAVSRIRGTQRVQEDTGGAAGIRTDTTLGRFGTVRPRVQIPGPRPKNVFKSRSSPAPSGAWGSQGGHRFSWDWVAAARSKWISNRQLNSPRLSHSRYISTRTAPGP